MILCFPGKQNVGLKELKESNTETESETNLSDLETETETELESTYSAGYSAGYKRGLAEGRERTGYHGITREARALQNIRSGEDNHYKNQFMKQLFEK